MASSDGILHSSQNPSHPTTVTVGNGSSVPVTRVGRTSLHSFKLDNVLVVPSIVTNLLSVRRFTRDNFVSIKFDPFGFSIKDLWTGTVRLRFNSSGDLYTIPPAVATRFHPNVVPTSPRALLATAPSVDLWHRRLGHPGRDVLQHLQKRSFISYNKNSTHSCHACQLGKHVRLPFGCSRTITTAPFQILHCDLWTSPLLSNSGFRYYLIIVDDYSHFYWTFPLKQKSDVFPIFQSFVSYVHTQFHLPLQCFQTDNGREFLNSAILSFFDSHGIILRTTCPYTSQQNGKAERSIHSTNDIIRCLLFQAHMPGSYWAEALSAATYLLNRRPCQPIQFATPFERLFGISPSLDHLRVFCCLCYPNLSATAPHKLAPRSTSCVFLGYPHSQKGYRCLDLTTKRVLVSRHVYFDEMIFPFSTAAAPSKSSSLDMDLSFQDDAPGQGVGPAAAHGQGAPAGGPPSPRPGPGARAPDHGPASPPSTPRPASPSARLASPPTPRPAGPMLPGSPPDGPFSSTGPVGAASPSAGRIAAASPPPAGDDAPSSSASTCHPPGAPSESGALPRPAPGPHPMVTRAKVGVVKPIDCLNLSTVHKDAAPLPKTYRTALQAPCNA